jgi:phosphoglycerate dehydrogenase-like enzyme
MSRAPQTVLVYNDEAEFYAQALRARFPLLEVRATASRGQALAWLGDCDTLVVSGPRADAALLAAGPRLRWVHALSSGTDTLVGSPGLAPGAVITSSRGVHGPQMAELALLLMMALSRQLPRMLAGQAAGTWERWSQPLLWGRHAVLLGVGHVGEALAQRCQALGMRVTGIASAPRRAAGFDAVRTRAEMAEAVSDADFLVVLLPHDASTHHLVDALVLEALPSHAFLVNLGRGGVVDEAALLAALQQGRLAGAGLDVFETEPLPADHPLRSLPNVIVTPHIGGQSDIYAEQVLPLLLANMQAMLAGDPAGLVNRVG